MLEPLTAQQQQLVLRERRVDVRELLDLDAPRAERFGAGRAHGSYEALVADPGSDRACLLGCAVITGVGAVLRVAEKPEGALA